MRCSRVLNSPLGQKDTIPTTGRFCLCRRRRRHLHITDVLIGLVEPLGPPSRVKSRLQVDDEGQHVKCENKGDDPLENGGYVGVVSKGSASEDDGED